MTSTTTLPRLRFNMRLLLVAVTGVAIGAYWLRPPVVSAKIEWIGHEANTNGLGLVAVFRVTNNAPNSLWYYGTSEQYPCCESESLSNGQWTSVSVGLCGMGISACELPKGESRVCREFVVDAEEKIRLSIDLSAYESLDEVVTVRSEPVDWRKLPTVPAEDDAT
jgi:hypothetical protein